ARIGAAARPADAELFLKTLQLAKLGQERPGFQAVAIVLIGDQAEDAIATPDVGLEPENGLDRVGAGPHHLARRGAIGGDGKAARRHAARQRRQRLQDGVSAIQRLDVPAQRQHVAPVAVRMEQCLQQGFIGLSERFLELRKPVVGGYRTVVRPVEHGRYPSPAVCAAFPCQSVYPFGTAQKGRKWNGRSGPLSGASERGRATSSVVALPRLILAVSLCRMRKVLGSLHLEVREWQ